MTLHELIEQYISEDSSLIPVSIAALRAFEKHVALHDDVPFTEYDLSQWQCFFSQARPGLMTLRRYRTSLLIFYDWLIRQGYDVSASRQVLNTYHVGDVLAQSALGQEGYDGSYGSLMDRLESIKIRDGEVRANYGALCSMFTLVWFGLEPQTAIDLKKTDLEFAEDGVIITYRDNNDLPRRLYVRNPRAVNTLRDYLQQSDAVRVDGRQLHLLDSEWLFRSTQSDHITLNAMQRYITGINQEIGVRSSFSLLRCHDSAVYAKAFAHIDRIGYAITRTPHPDLVRYLPRLLEVNAVTDVQAPSYAWRAFYSWCKRYRPEATR